MKIPLALPLFIAALLLSGCTQAQVDRAAAGAKQAELILARTVEAVAAAEQALEKAKEVAARLDNETATKVISEAQRVVDQAKNAVPVAQEAVVRATDAANAAQKAHEAGGGTLNVIAAAILAALGGWGGAAALAQRGIAKYMTALRLTAAHGDAMERAETDENVHTAKLTAIQAQEAAGVRALIQKARGSV